MDDPIVIFIILWMILMLGCSISVQFRCCCLVPKKNEGKDMNLLALAFLSLSIIIFVV